MVAIARSTRQMGQVLPNLLEDLLSQKALGHIGKPLEGIQELEIARQASL